MTDFVATLIARPENASDLEAAATACGAAIRIQRSDVLGANAVLMDAYNMDVRPLLAEVRTGLDLDPDPMGAYARSGYRVTIEVERVGGQQAGWGA